MADTQALIDAQFDRAVEIVQGLPKTGPIQTGYEEKLAMYSLYKQATAGNVKGPRPGMWDMLGRAKWDAWAKQKDLDPYESKWMYVETLKKVLRKYSDKTAAQDLVEELEGFEGDPENVLISGTIPDNERSLLNRSVTSSEAEDEARERAHASLQQSLHSSQYQSRSNGHQRSRSNPNPNPNPQASASTSRQQHQHQHQQVEESEDDITSDEDLPSLPPLPSSLPPIQGQTQSQSQSQVQRPHSSHSYSSQHRYRTPLAHARAGPGTSFSPASIPQLPGGIPNTQPLPRYATPSIFSPPPPPSQSQGTQSGGSPIVSGTSIFPNGPYDESTQTWAMTSGSGSGVVSERDPLISVSGSGLGGLQRLTGGGGGGEGERERERERLRDDPRAPLPHPTHLNLSSQMQMQGSLIGLERAVESVQAKLAALRERVEGIEMSQFGGSPSGGGDGGWDGSWSGRGGRGGRGGGGSGQLGHRRNGSSLGNHPPQPSYDPSQMGLWSSLLTPLSHLSSHLTLLRLFISSPNSIPGYTNSTILIIIRRLLLDASFLVFLAWVVRRVLRRVGVTRGMVRGVVGRVLGALWGVVVVGMKGGEGERERVMVERGV